MGNALDPARQRIHGQPTNIQGRQTSKRTPNEPSIWHDIIPLIRLCYMAKVKGFLLDIINKESIS